MVLLEKIVAALYMSFLFYQGPNKREEVRWTVNFDKKTTVDHIYSMKKTYFDSYANRSKIF